MRLIELQARNFSPWKQLGIKLYDRGLVLISGPKGAGKSSIFNAIQWGLFGDSFKKVLADDVVNNEVGKDCWVGIDTDTLHIDRYRKDKLHSGADSLQMFQHGKLRTTRHMKVTQERINHALGLIPSAFTGISYVSGSQVSLLDLTPGKQQELFDHFCGLEQLQEALKSARAAERDIESRLSEVQWQKEDLRRRMSEAIQESQRQSPDVRRLEHQLNSLRKRQAQLDQERLEAQEHLREIQQGLWESISRSEGIRRQSTPLRQQVDRVSNLVGKPCPTCTQPVTSRVAERVAVKINANLESLKHDLEEVEHQVDERKALVEESTTKLTATEKMLESIRREQSTLSIELAKQVNQYSQEVSSLHQQLRGVYGRIVDLKQQLSYTHFWVQGFGKEGIRQQLIETFVGVLDQALRNYQNYFRGLHMDCTLDKGQIRISAAFSRGGRSFGQLSSGEQTCANLVLSMALRELVKFQYPGASSNVLLFDEVMDKLDPVSQQEAVQFLQSLVNENVETVLVISHREDFKELFPQTWTVEKHDGFSRLIES